MKLDLLVVFRLEGQRYALALGAVERFIRAVEITPLPNAPAAVLGVIDVAGRVLPVLNVRQRFGLPERPVCPADHFLIAHCNSRAVVLAIDEALDVADYSATGFLETTGIVPGLEHIRGIVQLHDGMVLIHDLDTFLLPAEALSLNHALQPEAVHDA